MADSKIEQMLLDVTNGRPAPANESAADRLMRRRLERQVQAIAREGGIVEIPPELP